MKILKKLLGRSIKDLRSSGSMSCSPSQAEDEWKEPLSWKKLKQRFPWINRPPYDPGQFHDDDDWDPSGSITESPSPGIEGIFSYLDISTIHITPRDRALLLQLNENSKLTAIQHNFGTIVFIPSEYDRPDIDSYEFSKYFHLVINYAVDSGCRLINFDGDGERLDGLFSQFEE